MNGVLVSANEDDDNYFLREGQNHVHRRSQ